MRVLAAVSLGGAGHLTPLLPFLKAARAQRDSVLVVGPPALQDMVEGAGMPFVAGGEPSEQNVAPIRERLPVASPAEASVLGSRELFGRMATAAMLPAMVDVCASWGPDLILREPCEHASAVVASRMGIPMAQVAISLAQAEAGSIAAAAPALEEHRPGLTEALRTSPYLTRFPQSLDPSPFPSTVRYQEPPLAGSGGLPDWWEGSDDPFVYMTFGTVLGHMSFAAEVYGVALRAVDGLPVRVLLFDASSLDAVPSNVHVESWIDQGDVLPHADLVVSHGGSGTSYGALAAGVPLVLVPVFADQFENARRIAHRGAGLMLEPGEARTGERSLVITKDDAARITDAIARVLATPSYREEAGHVAAEMASGPTPPDVLDALCARTPGG